MNPGACLQWSRSSLRRSCPVWLSAAYIRYSLEYRCNNVIWSNLLPPCSDSLCNFSWPLMTTKDSLQRTISIVSVFTRTWLRYVRVFAVANPSIVCNVGAPYSGGWSFRQYFLHRCVSWILWLACKFLRRVPGNPSVRSAKRKRGIKNRPILDLSKAIPHKRYKIDV